MSNQIDWQELAINSHYITAVAVQNCLKQGNVMEATEGLDALVEAMGRCRQAAATPSEKRALRSQLVRLMVHVIKWKSQPQKRSSSWAISILSARREIEGIQEDTPSLNRNVIESMWEKSLKEAVKEAELEMRQKCDLKALSWSEVFEEEYTLLD